MASILTGTSRGFVRVVLFMGAPDERVLWAWQQLVEWWIDPATGQVIRRQVQYG